MNVLAKHIESLLINHNCVIVPELGGFVAGYVPATYLEEEKLFLPPKRSVGFNPSLSLNDGLLVQSYMYAYDVNFPEATAMIENTVNDLKKELQNRGEVSLGNIGKIYLSVDGRYEFTHSESGILSPDLYALDAFTITPTDSKTTKLDVEDEAEKAKSKKSYILRINKQIVNYAAAAVVAVFFYIMWATPLSTISTTSNVASIIPTPAQIEQVQQESQVDLETVADTLALPVVAEVQATPEENIEVICPENCFTIVLVSKVSLKNANDHAQLLASEGFDKAKVFQKGKMTRVIYNTYSTQEEAYAHLSELKQQSEYFANAWILEL
jgi:cell division septation protein DedD